MDSFTAGRILEILRSEFSALQVSHVKRDPFETLIRAILSQSTTSINTERAFKRLAERFEVSPSKLANVSVTEIESAIKIAGLQRNKARVIKAVSSEILKRFGGNLDFVYTAELSEAREKLMSLPGVGPKTCDVVLLFSAGRPVIPVDTHVKRVSERLKIAEEKSGYEELRNALESLFKAKDYLAVHLAFIALGRKYCRARKPRCLLCPIREFCATGSKYSELKFRIRSTVS